MKKVLFVLVALLVGGARADNIVTSREYVDTQANTLQTELPAKNTNTVLLNTATAGAPGEKAIYDSAAAYATQTDALVTAGTFNTAVQNALESEFVCIERNDQGCLLYEIRSASQQQTLPAGYTQLEYIESTGTQYIDTNVVPTANRLQVNFKMQKRDAVNYSNFFGAVDTVTPRKGYRMFTLENKPRHLYLQQSYYADFNVTNVLDIINCSSTVINGVGVYITVNGQGVIPRTLETHPIDTTLDHSILISAIHLGSNASGFGAFKIWSFEIIKDGIAAFNGIPARRDSDGELGMYDIVTNTFFTNQGTGTFIAGPVFSYLPQAQ